MKQLSISKVRKGIYCDGTCKIVDCNTIIHAKVTVTVKVMTVIRTAPLRDLIELIFCQAQPKPKPNHSWAVLVLNPTSPTTRPPGRPKKYEAGTFEPGLQNKSY